MRSAYLVIRGWRYQAGSTFVVGVEVGLVDCSIFLRDVLEKGVAKIFDCDFRYIEAARTEPGIDMIRAMYRVIT
jgi:hypothetical protein